MMSAARIPEVAYHPAERPRRSSLQPQESLSSVARSTSNASASWSCCIRFVPIAPASSSSSSRSTESPSRQALPALLREADELGAAVRRIRDTLDGSERLELVDELRDGLLGHADARGEVDDACSFEIDVREEVRVRRAERRSPRARSDAGERFFVREARGLEEELERALALRVLETCGEAGGVWILRSSARCAYGQSRLTKIDKRD